MRKLYFMYLLTCLVGFVGCVEIRDPEETQNPEAQSEDARRAQPLNLVVDRPLYLYKGNILEEEQYRALEADRDTVQDRLEYRFDELSFSPSGVLYTLGAQVRISARVLQAEGGVLATFPLDIRAPANTEGRSGGLVILRAQLAEGDLLISMRGEHGGHGENGAPPTPDMKGETGADAAYLGCPLLVKIDRAQLVGGTGGKGMPGNNATNGGNGGATGFLDVEITEKSDLVLKVEKFKGLGGLGGRGGDGGEGGDAGRYGCLDPRDLGREVPQGPVGDRGSDGVDGLPGAEQTACQKKNQILTCN